MFVLVAIEDISFGGFLIARIEQDVFHDILDLLHIRDNFLDHCPCFEHHLLCEFFRLHLPKFAGSITRIKNRQGNFFRIEGRYLPIAFFNLFEHFNLHVTVVE